MVSSSDSSGIPALSRRALLMGLMATPLAACTNTAPSRPSSPTNENTTTPTPSGSATTPTPTTRTTTPRRGPTNPRTPTGPSLTVEGTLLTGLKSPWALTFLPDGNAILGSRDSGEVRQVIHGSGRAESLVIGTMPDVVHAGEGGLLSIVPSPTFATDHHLFVYHSTGSDNRITRITYTYNALSDPTTVLDGIPSNSNHNGGALAFGPDGYLYVGTGDAGDSDHAQDRDSLGGKILRITRDGKAAPGNPFGTRVFSYGHRNVEAIAFNGNQLWAVEFGANAYDELNRIDAGANYGWPQTEGMTTEAGITAPAVVWPTDDAGPCDLTIRNGVAWIACLTGRCLYRVELTATGADEPKRYLTDTYGRLRRTAFAPDGKLWVVTNNTDGRGTPKDGDDRILALNVR